MQQNVKSPFNYIGGKFKLLPQIKNFFPTKINKYVDLFAGGLDVAINVNAEHKECNDINNYLIDIFIAMQNISFEDLIDYIDRRIDDYNLSKTNTDGYLELRRYYNEFRNPLDLYVLICFSFNYQIRFNSQMEYNNPFGRNRSSFTNVMRDNLRVFHERIKNIHFSSFDFKQYDLDGLRPGDFVYADPPYLISCGSYNDGKRGFKGWSPNDDIALFDKLDELSIKGVRFAMSNVCKHKGRINEPLIEWMNQYNVHFIEKNYRNSNYRLLSKNTETQEVLVTNY